MDEQVLGVCLSNFIDRGSAESHQFFRARKTALEMLSDRGYAVDSSEIELSLAQFRSIYGPATPDLKRLRYTVSLRSNPSEKVMLVFCEPVMVKVSDVRNIKAEIVDANNISGMILVVKNKLTSQAKKELELFPLKVEIFQINDLLVNITKHVLMPKHKILNDREKQEFLRTHDLDEKQLPRISLDDAVAIYYGLKKGQVVKVVYDGEKMQGHATYRCVW